MFFSFKGVWRENDVIRMKEKKFHFDGIVKPFLKDNDKMEANVKKIFENLNC